MEYPKSGEAYLENIRSLWRERRSLESALAQKMAEIVSIKSPQLDKERVDGGGINGGIDAKLEQKETLEEKLARKIRELDDARSEAEDLIAFLENPAHRAVLREYYLTGHTLEETGATVGWAWRHVVRIKDEALAEFEAVYAVKKL